MLQSSSLQITDSPHDPNNHFMVLSHPQLKEGEFYAGNVKSSYASVYLYSEVQNGNMRFITAYDEEGRVMDHMTGIALPNPAVENKIIKNNENQIDKYFKKMFDW